MLGQTIERLLGGHVQDWVAVKDRQALDAMLAVGQGRTEICFHMADGVEIPTLVSAVAVAGPGPGPAGICLVVTDLTERNLHEARILQLNEELEQRVSDRTAELRAANQELVAANQELTVAEDQLTARNREPGGFSGGIRESEDRLRVAVAATNLGTGTITRLPTCSPGTPAARNCLACRPMRRLPTTHSWPVCTPRTTNAPSRSLARP